MAKVKITHPSITNEDATQAPKREPVPEGKYAALIMSANLGATQGTPPLGKVVVEFQVLFGITEENAHDETYQGRRVYQDYILEHDPSMPDLSATRRYELRMLLDACDVKYDDEGFDTDELTTKNVIITVRHRKGRQLDPDTNKFPVFTNVVKVDTTEEVGADDIV